MMKLMMKKICRPVIVGVLVMTAPVLPLQAETIIIGKGVGIVWEGKTFNESHYLSGRWWPDLNPYHGMLAISDSPYGCMQGKKLAQIGGYMAYPLPGISGVGLIPRATGSASYVRPNGTDFLNGTIGLPKTQGSSTSQSIVTSPNNYVWCLPPQTWSQTGFYSFDGGRMVNLSGTWVMVADGTQQTGETTIPPMYFGSYDGNPQGGGPDFFVSILPSTISLRVSTLECTVNTPTTINFGTISRKSELDAELAVKSVPLVTSCGQDSGFYINANINVQFRSISGLYNSDASKLMLNQGGGYITGEIDNGLTGSGVCGASTGLRFNNTPIKLGSITNVENSKILTNQLTWRLCSGGNSLPTGAVSASTEMLVTFN